MTKKIFFRADASAKVGLGHLTRCLALASILKEKFDCSFILKDSVESSFDLLRESGFTYQKLAESNVVEEGDQISKIVNSNDIVVVDGYQFTEAYFAQITMNGAKLVLIDDFMKGSVYADVLINHAVGLPENTFKKNARTKYCLGEKYAMLRRPFLFKAKQQRQISKVENVFICFGGADYFNVTLKILKALETADSRLRFHLVLASTFPFVDEVKSFLKSTSMKVELYYNLNAQQMADLMHQCEIAIAPTSGLSYEICAVGMGYLGGYYINNQIAIHNGFLQKNCLVSVGDFTKISGNEIFKFFSHLVCDINKINNLLVAQRELIDGASDKNFLKVFSSL